MKSFLIFGLLFTVAVFSGCDQSKKKTQASYQIENIALPEGLSGQVGGLDFLPDGQLASCFSSGEVMLFNPKKKSWKLFATGLHDPLGILAESPSSILVMQRPELTRLIDQDGDGTADQYETVIDSFGISGNYHEFAYGPVKDKAGNIYIALNTASNGGGVMKEVRGTLNPLTMDHPKQMFSPVPYRGWIMKYTPEGKLLPYASGFRSPNGLGFDLEGNLFATDNQGDWVPTSTLYQIEEGKFYGHPASLVWQKNWHQGNPYKLNDSLLNNMRQQAVVLFPQGIMASSPSQPVVDNTGGKFGPFEGQFFVGEMDIPRILRVMLEKIDGHLQGACIPFIDSLGLHKGNNRLAFAPDGSLWVGQNDHGWAGDRGIQRIQYTDNMPLEILRIHLTPTGFDFTFTSPLDPAGVTDTSHYRIRHYRYHYSSRYGSDQFDVKNVPVKAIKLSGDHKTVSLQLDAVEPEMIYEFDLSGLTSEDGKPLAHHLTCYTVDRLNTDQ